MNALQCTASVQKSPTRNLLLLLVKTWIPLPPLNKTEADGAKISHIYRESLHSVRKHNESLGVTAILWPCKRQVKKTSVGGILNLDYDREQKFESNATCSVTPFLKTSVSAMDFQKY